MNSKDLSWDSALFLKMIEDASTKVSMDKSDIAERGEIDKGWISAIEVLNDPNFVVKKEDYQRDNNAYYYATYFVFGAAIVATAFYGYY